MIFPDNKKNTPFSVEYKSKQKFSQKVMIWLAISERGRYDIFVTPAGLEINSQVYIDECIRARLVPLINQLHGYDEKFILATLNHYLVN